ncbi:MAG: hypothetical protein KGL53_15565 [Elusimicrobia bacterium]|nr:hypothetical protein [Elusimicrobiota bacterium]
MPVFLAFLVRDAEAKDVDSNHSFTYQSNILHYANKVTGLRSGSYLSPGQWNTDDLSLGYKYSNGDVFYESGMDMRIADDPSVEPSTFSVKRFVIHFGDKASDVVIGDYMASLSNYSLGTSLKGARYTYKFSDTVQGTVLAGSPRGTWRELWGGTNSATLDRQYYGGRLAKTWANGALIGADVVTSNDSRVPTADPATISRQRLGSFEWALPPFHNLALSGESAYSWTRTDDPGQVSAYILDGWAHIVKDDFSYKGFKNHVEFERVSPYFATNGGSASPDLIRCDQTNEYRFRGPWKVVANYSWFHNNLKGVDGTNTSTTRLPEVGLNYDGPDWRPSLSVDVKAHSRAVNNAGTGVKTITRGGTLDVADTFHTIAATLEIVRQDVAPTDGSSHQRNDTVTLGANTTKNLPWGISVNPSVNWNFEVDRDLLIGNKNRTSTLTGNLTAQFPGGFDSSVGYNDNKTINGTDPSSEVRTFTATAGYNIHGNSQTRFELHFKRNENYFTDNKQNYQETIGEALLNFSL